MKDTNSQKPLVKMKGITKDFPGVRALSNMTFQVYKGEVHCLVGENGAGKSTLMKILSGAYTPTSGSIFIEGNEYTELNPPLSQELGIQIVYQENDLVPTMNAVENIFVGQELSTRFGMLNFKEMRRKVQKLIDEYGIDLDLSQTIENMSVADQQYVKILKALMKNSKLLIMDEPTAAFNETDSEKVLTLVRRISDRGISVIYISHLLEEVVQIADRLTVIRDGTIVRTYDKEDGEFLISSITTDMVGRPVEMFYGKEPNPIGDVMFEVKGLRLSNDSPEINFNVRQGEIVGIAGLVGAGRTEIVRAIAGADRRYAGDFHLNGEKLKLENPRDSIKAGIAHITEDRQRLGLNLSASVLENLLLVNMPNIKTPSRIFFNSNNYASDVRPIVDDLNIRTPSLQTPALFLSGGNQQKVVLGKWIYAKGKVYIFDEPTRGIDVNAKEEFYKQMSHITQAGNCIIMVSSDMPELISMSDRILVVCHGAITEELTDGEMSEEKIITCALGVNANE